MPESAGKLKPKSLRRHVQASAKHQALKYNVKFCPRLWGNSHSFPSQTVTKCLFHSRSWVSVKDRQCSDSRPCPDGAHSLVGERDTQPDNDKTIKTTTTTTKNPQMGHILVVREHKMGRVLEGTEWHLSCKSYTCEVCVCVCVRVHTCVGRESSSSERVKGHNNKISRQSKRFNQLSKEFSPKFR